LNLEVVTRILRHGQYVVALAVEGVASAVEGDEVRVAEGNSFTFFSLLLHSPATGGIYI